MLVDIREFYSHKLDNINKSYINVGWGNPAPKNETFIQKICDSFNERLKDEPITPKDEGPSEWTDIVREHEEIIRALRQYNIELLNREFSNLFSSCITNGTTQGRDQTQDYLNSNPETLYNHVLYVYDKLLDVMECSGLLTAFSPEEYVWVKHYDKFLIDPNIYLDILMNAYKCDLTAPKYAGMMFGMKTKYGVYSIKDMHALGLALQLYEKFKHTPDISICEIGAGVGQLAYYMNKLGFKNYHIVDLPTISVSQMFFLGSNLENQNTIVHVPINKFDGKYDVVLNVDSLPEMSKDAAYYYLQKIAENCPYFISVNQERRKTFLVRDLCEELRLRRVSRNLWWMRKGYVIEEWRKQ